MPLGGGLRYRYRPSRTGTREVKGTGTGPVLLVANADYTLKGTLKPLDLAVSVISSI
jgi:hypothetical protein